MPSANMAHILPYPSTFKNDKVEIKINNDYEKTTKPEVTA